MTAWIVRYLEAAGPYLLAVVLLIAGAKLAVGQTGPAVMLAQASPPASSGGDQLVGYAALLAALTPVLTAVFVGIERCIRAWRAPGDEADARQADLPPAIPPPEPGRTGP